MKLKKFLISAISIMLGVCFSFSGCINYDGYRRVKLPDEQLGSVMLPENWEVTTENGYLCFKDADSGEIIAEEHFRGIYIYDIYYDIEKITDERVYNEKFKDYIELEGIEGSGNSNGGQYGIFRCMVEGKEMELGSLLFIGRNSNYSLEMYVIQEVPSEVLSKIAKSYEYERQK